MSGKSSRKPGNARQTTALDRHIGQRIRLARQIANMSQEKLGEQLGVSFQQVQKYERGTNRISAARLHTIAEIFERPLTFFYEGFSNAPAASIETSAVEREMADLGIHAHDAQAAFESLERLPSPVRGRIISLIRTIDGAEDETAED